jgi:formamidopyrimidine-DNA glycosylase
VPELPDLVYIVRHLAPGPPPCGGRTVPAPPVREPVVIRMTAGGDFAAAIAGRRLASLRRHGPFLVFGMQGPPGAAETGMVAHLMLSGHWQLAAGSRPTKHECFALSLDDGRALRYGDETRMGRIYVGPPTTFVGIPGFSVQGVDPTSPAFTLEAFRRLIRGKRCQVRVLVMDQALISAVGNAYADEILFAAGLHPKTRCHQLSEAEVDRLHAAIAETLRRGIEEVERAARPVEVKVRDHMKVRNRKGEPCPACGATIRRAVVLGYDAFFCPSCQPERGGRGIPWTTRPGP